ncbi:MAG TPA: signal peptide peptidase SppA [Thermoplasmata archaeon]|nr:signal peptide peptidase SppA [Thermoplasmata archaeon]
MRELLAHVQFRGTIRERSVEPFLRLLQALRTKRRVRGVLFDISSGGGSDIPSTDLYLAVKRLDAVKPVIASIGSLGASGAYMAAIGARKVYAYPDSGVGSIGVVFPHIAVRRLLEKVGVDVELLHEGRHKDAYQGLRPLSDEERAKLQAVTKDSYDSFVGMVARERKRPVADILPLATGEFWSGRKALELGLVDALGDREEALAELSRITGVPPSKAVRVAPPRPFFERVFSGGMSSLVPGLASGVRDAVEDAVWDGLLYGR